MRSFRHVPLTVLVAIALPAIAAAQGGGPGGPGGAPGGGGQQQPPKNLQVLPKDMPRAEVVARMRTFTGALGVRCEYCHVAVKLPDGREQVQDYSLDDKDTKKTARDMLRMVGDINDKYLKAMGRTMTDRTRVSCETCHHGIAKPRTIQAEVGAAIDAAGPDSAIALYRDLRTRYYMRQSYDFGELALTQYQQYASGPEKLPAAIAILKLNLEFYPTSVPTMSALAAAQVQAGDTAAAVQTLNKALVIQPDNPQVRGLLGRLKPPAPQD